MASDQDSAEPYHERQSKQLCALHALNNLMQDRHAFTQQALDDICQRLSPDAFINPHRSMLGLGNYDVNVLMAALQEKGMETVWFDKRKDVSMLDVDQIMGFILNIPSDFKIGFLKLPLHRKHWIAIRCFNGKFMNLDSKLDKPETIGDGKTLLQYFQSELEEGDKELILIMDKSVYGSSSWKRNGLHGEESWKCSEAKEDTANFQKLFQNGDDKMTPELNCVVKIDDANKSQSPYDPNT